VLTWGSAGWWGWEAGVMDGRIEAQDLIGA
jgi:hypothetical protein